MLLSCFLDNSQGGMFNPEFLTSESDAISGNDLIKYLQEQSPDVLQPPRPVLKSGDHLCFATQHLRNGTFGLLPSKLDRSQIQ